MNRLISIWTYLMFVTMGAQGQAFTATWPLSSASTVTGAATGAVTAAPEVLGAGPAPALSVFDYQATGQRLWAGNSGWVGGPESPTRFVQFDVTPNIGSLLTVTSVSFEYGASAALNTIESNVWYSTNNWVTRTQLNNSPLLYQRVSLAQFTASPTIPVSGGAAFSLRIYPYASQNSSAGSPTFAVHNSVRIAGDTAPASTCDYLCNTDFEQFANISGPTTFVQTAEANILCWSTTASNSAIEIWNGAGMGVPAYAGSFFAELNATQTATLFQSFQAVAGNQVAISFAHRGRYAAPDVMAVEIGPAGGPYVVLGSYTDNNSGWSHYTVNYTLPTTGTMELRFNSISSNGGAGPADGGNFLDAIAISCPSGICGMKFNDLDGDGSQGAAEPGIADWTITLGGTATQTTTTNVNGQFCFLDLAPGDYTVAEVSQTGWIQTLPAPTAGGPGTYAVTLESDQTVESINFGNQLQVTGICTDTPQGLVGWWSGDNHANDYSGLANHGSLQGGAGYGVGQVANGFRVNNFADFVSVPDAPSLDFGPGQDFTIDLWLKTKQTGQVWIVDKRTSSSGSVLGYALYISGGKLGFQMGDGAWQNYLSTGPTINDDQWHFVAVSVDRNSTTGITMVVDNAPPQYFNPTGIAGDLGNTSAFLIGRYGLGPALGFGGTIDEVEVFGRALSREEIVLVYGAGAAGKCKDDRVQIEGSKFEDLDGDGEWDPNETGLGGVVIEFLQDGVVVVPATTDGSGGFVATVSPGTYTVQEVMPNGYYQTAPAGGSYTVTVSNGGAISGLLFGNAPIPSGLCIAPPAHMVGWWTGDVDGSDLSGNGNHGTLQGAAPVTPGFVAGAFTLAVSGDFITVPDAPSINFGPGQDFSIDAWIRTNDGNSIVQIVDKRDSNFFGVVGYSLFLHTGRLAFQIAEAPFGHATYISTAPVVSDGLWHFVAVTVDRDSKTGLRLFVDNHPVDVFDPTARDGSLVTTMPLYIGSTGLGSFGVNPFRGQIDEVEMFNSALADTTIASLFLAGEAGKCKDQVDGSCNDTLNSLPVGTGIDHPANALYAVGGNDAFWTITADPDPTRTVPRPAEVIMTLPTWGAAQAGTVWIGPSQITPDPPFFEQDAIGLGTHTYTLEFCIFGQTATSLTFNLGVLADNAAKVWLRESDGTRTFVGSAPANAFTTPTSITSTLPGPFPAGTYYLEVDVFNDAVPPDFTGMNLSGTITGADLYMQKHECCNSSGKITGTKFSDLNGDGLSVGDPGLPLVEIQLWQGGSQYGPPVYTDSAGEYYFDVPPGTYTVIEVVPTGYAQTAPTGGSYTITVGPGGIAANVDFLNHAIPCITASTEMLCRPNGQRFLRLTITYTGTDPVHGLNVSSLTPGVSFTLTTPPTYPILPGATVVVDIDFTGLGAGASAQLLINMDGPEDEFGVASSCCDETITVTRPGGPHTGFEVYCPLVVIGDVLIGDSGDPTTAVSNVGLVVRARSASGRSLMTRTGPEGFFVFEGLQELAWDVAPDVPFRYQAATDSQPSYAVRFNEQNRSAELHFLLVPGTHTGTEGLDGSVPTEYSLGSNYPNPFNPTTTIRYGIPVGGSVRLVVFDMLGRVVASPVDEVQSAGMHEVTFDAGDLSSGMYLYRLESGSYAETRKMVLMK